MWGTQRVTASSGLFLSPMEGDALGTKQKAQPLGLSLFLFLLYKFRISD
jgi:hypothetical protein